MIGYGCARAGLGMQLELCLWSPRSLRGTLIAYLAAVSKKIADATAIDYQDRADWLCKVFGNATPIDEITFLHIERVTRDYGPGGRIGTLKWVTLRKRLRMLRAAFGYAADRGLMMHAQIPRLPPQLCDDGERGATFYTPEEFERFIAEVPSERARRYFQIGFWTGHHTHDIRSMLRWMVDPDYEWIGLNGEVLARGRYWRRNHKNKRCEPAWVPMEPEFRTLVLAWIAANPRWGDNDRLTGPGRCWGMCKTARLAASRAGLEYVTPNLGMRRSFATMLASRYPDMPEYLRQLMGHEGEMVIRKAERGHAASTNRPSMLTSHYLRASKDLMLAAVAARR